jgi:hypothetical protein
MGICKRWKLGLTMLQFMRLCRRLPGGLATMLPENECMATTSLSNFGELTYSMKLPECDGRLVAGNVALTCFDVLPSIRPLTTAAFGVTSYERRLSLAVHCDPYKFSPAGAQQLLGTYARTIIAVAANPDVLPDADVS